MDLSMYTNLQNRLNSMRGGSKIGEYLLIGLFGLFTVAGVAGLFSGGGVGAAIVAVIFGIVTVVFVKAIPKEKKEGMESWARLDAGEMSRIDAESMTAPAFGNALITSDAVIIKRGQGPLAIAAKDILWIYGKTVTHKLYGVIPTGKDYSIQVLRRSGETATLPSPNARKNRKEQNPMQQDILTLANILKPRHPGIILGYNQQVQAIASKNVAELAQIVDAANARQQ